MRPYHRYLPHGPARPVPRLLFMAFPGHRTMAEVIEEERRKEKREKPKKPDDVA